MYNGLKTSSHSCKAISSSIVCHCTSNSNFLNPGGLSICNSLRVFLFIKTLALLRVLLLSTVEFRSARSVSVLFSSLPLRRLPNSLPCSSIFVGLPVHAPIFNPEYWYRVRAKCCFYFVPQKANFPLLKVHTRRDDQKQNICIVE